jgi:hypothetical protein
MDKLPKPILKMIADYLETADKAHFSAAAKRYLFLRPGFAELMQKYIKLRVEFKKLEDWTETCDLCGQYEKKDLIDECTECNKDVCKRCMDDYGYCIECIKNFKCGYDCDKNLPCDVCRELICDNHSIASFVYDDLTCIDCYHSRN